MNIDGDEETAVSNITNSQCTSEVTKASTGTKEGLANVTKHHQELLHDRVNVMSCNELHLFTGCLHGCTRSRKSSKSIRHVCLVGG
jgi:hypothetical protein